MCHQSDCSAGHYHQGCCCGTGYTQRHFHTREESIEDLQEYLKQLKAEAKGVEERIADLHKGS